MKTGAIVSIIVAILSMGAVVAAFLFNASPYVTIAQAREMSGNALHVVGDIDKSTVRVDPTAGVVHFIMEDEQGDRVKVKYKGPPPSNMGEATRVVCVGGMKGEELEAHKLLIKCPSKYEGTLEG